MLIKHLNFSLISSSHRNRNPNSNAPLFCIILNFSTVRLTVLFKSLAVLYTMLRFREACNCSSVRYVLRVSFVRCSCWVGLSKLRTLGPAVCHNNHTIKLVYCAAVFCGLVAISLHYNCTHNFLVFLM